MLSEKNIKNLTTVALLVTQKFYCDDFKSNNIIAKLANTDLNLLNANELEFMTLIDWNVVISYEDLEFYMACSDTFFNFYENEIES